MSHPDSIPVTADPQDWRAEAVSRRNGLIVVTLVLASSTIIAGRSLFTGVPDVALWLSVSLTLGAFALLVGACLRAALVVQAGPGHDRLVFRAALGGLAALGLALAVAWLAPPPKPAESTTLPAGFVSVSYFAGQWRDTVCATVVQDGTGLRLTTREGKIILVPQGAIVEMSSTGGPC